MSIDFVTSIFVPLGQDEIYRILKENGYWIVVGPGPKHCFELKEVLYDTPYENEMPEILEQYELVNQEIIQEIKMVDDFVNQWQVQVVSPIEVDGEAQPVFSYYPLFGQAAEVEPCIVIYAKEQ